MCFRPTGADMPDPVCPECGKKLTIIGDIMIKKCPFCKADLSKYEEEFNAMKAGAGAPGAPAAPGALGAPKAPPSAPSPPKASGAPKAPSV